MDKWIIIGFKNGEMCHYKPQEYTDYRYDEIDKFIERLVGTDG